MQFTLSSSLLNNRLLTLAKVISNKNSINILECFLFEVKEGVLVITASDSENVMETELALDECEGNGCFAIANRTIIDALKEIPEQPLTFKVDTNTFNIQIAYLNGVYNFTAQDATEYPRLQPMAEDAHVITITSSMLQSALTRTMFAAAATEIRPIMSSVYFDFGEDYLTLVATDGHKLARSRNFTVKTEEPAAFILPKKPVNLLKSILAKDDSDVVIRFSEGNAEIKYAGGTLSCILLEGRYFNYNSVIPANNPNEMSIDRKAFLGALRRVSIFASESSQLIRLHITAGNLELSAEDIDFATSAKENVICEYAGKPMDIGFKSSALSDILNNLESDEIIVKLADPSRACVIVPTENPENEDILMLLMPMLLND